MLHEEGTNLALVAGRCEAIHLTTPVCSQYQWHAPLATRGRIHGWTRNTMQTQNKHAGQINRQIGLSEPAQCVSVPLAAHVVAWEWLCKHVQACATAPPPLQTPKLPFLYYGATPLAACATTTDMSLHATGATLRRPHSPSIPHAQTNTPMSRPWPDSNQCQAPCNKCLPITCREQLLCVCLFSTQQ
jgi:hypothetical protein